MPKLTTYHQKALNPIMIQRIAKSAKLILKKNKIDAVAVTGVSGLVVGGAVSAISGIPLIVVRKPTDDCHSGHNVETYSQQYEPYDTWAILDDFVATGNTVRRIMARIVEENSDKFGIARIVRMSKPEFILTYYQRSNLTHFNGIPIIHCQYDEL